MPIELEGYFLAKARSSQLRSTACEDLKNARSHDDNPTARVCAMGQQMFIRGGEVECTRIDGADPNALLACLTEFELYECEVEGSCEGGGTVPHELDSSIHHTVWIAGNRRLQSTTARETARVLEEQVNALNSTCRFGHEGVLCDVCINGYHRNSVRECVPCPEGSAGPVFAGIGAICLLVGLFMYVQNECSTATETAQACTDRAARGATVLRRACGARVRSMTPKSIRRRMSSRRREAPVRPYPSWHRYVTAFSAGLFLNEDRTMLFIGFIQVLTEFESTFDLQWPSLLTDIWEARDCGGFATDDTITFYACTQRTKLFNLDVAEVASASCANREHVNFFNDFFVVVCVPVVLTLVIYCGYKSRTRAVRRKIEYVLLPHQPVVALLMSTLQSTRLEAVCLGDNAPERQRGRQGACRCGSSYEGAQGCASVEYTNAHRCDKPKVWGL